MFKLISFVPVWVLLTVSCLAQTPSWSDDLLNRYDRYRESAIQDRRFKHAEMEPLILSLARKPGFEVRERGQSIEGRPIYVVRYGTGPVKVLLWSQMHGDESTATMALFDLFKFLQGNDEFNNLRALFREQLSLYFIPMLNPDGAELYQRRNAIDIDINRDALRLQTPEGALLKKIRDEIDADWGFNLHDQSKYNAVGPTSGEATFSFLAPAFDSAKSVNEKRKNAMQMVVVLNRWLQQYIPGQVARFDDAFEPRAFGDNMQRWGTRTILIECGGLEGDPEKQKIRKFHFDLLLVAFESIARQSYETYSIQSYQDLFYNDRHLMDLLIRDARLVENGKSYIVDLGFNRNENPYNSSRNYYYQSMISDIGDLSTSNAYEELGASGYTLEPGKLYPTVLTGLSSLKQMNFSDLHRQGYTDVRVQSVPNKSDVDELPFRLYSAKAKAPDNAIRLGENPSFFLVKGGKRAYVVVNGFLYKVE
ncbi:MAG: peptidase M14 [Saprospirales bacterium]|nr:peptidase M14 [Saprospirales bacterium]